MSTGNLINVQGKQRERKNGGEGGVFLGGLSYRSNMCSDSEIARTWVGYWITGGTFYR